MGVIRVLHVFHSMGCGGAENMIMNLYRKIDREKIQFDFLVHTQDACFFDSEIISLGGNIYRAPYYRITNELEYRKYLKTFFDKHREISIVHGHLGSCAHIYLKIAKQYGCFTIAHSHSSKPTDASLKNVIYRFFTYMTRRTADYFIGCSQKAGEYRFGNSLAHSEKFSVLKNAIDAEKYQFNEDVRSKIRNEFGIKNEILIGHVGRFTYAKNHSFLLEVFKHVHAVNKETKLILVGDGELRNDILNMIKDKGLQKDVIVTGLRSDVDRVLQGVDCFVFPSNFEGLPVSVVEAQAAGLPCFISDRITDEVIVTDLVKSLSIEGSAEIWSDQILALKRSDQRKNTITEIKKSGYDIVSSALWLTDFYLEKAKHNDFR